MHAGPTPVAFRGGDFNFRASFPDGVDPRGLRQTLAKGDSDHCAHTKGAGLNPCQTDNAREHGLGCVCWSLGWVDSESGRVGEGAAHPGEDVLRLFRESR